ncbi:transglutaminase-like domain-containing protein [Thermodesulfobacteriota bacterium]
MHFKRMKPFWISVALSALVFAVLFAFRLDLFNTFYAKQYEIPVSPVNPMEDRDSWMNIFQGGRKIGFSHSTFLKKEKGYELKEILFMRINTMGLVQDIRLETRGRLNDDYSLSSFDFEIGSGRFHFSAKGAVTDHILSIKTGSSGSAGHIDIELKEKLYLTAGIVDSVMASGLMPGDRRTFQVFDPATMGQEPVIISVMDKEDIQNMGIKKRATKVSLTFKGMTQLAWIGEDGQVLKEKGFLGIILEKTTRDDALFGLPVQSSQDLTRVASIPSNIVLDEVGQLNRLKVEIGGIKSDDLFLDGGRQTFRDHLLSIQKESLSGLPTVLDLKEIQETAGEFIAPSPFIQSDHPAIQSLAEKIVSENDTPSEKAQKLLDWIHKNIEKRPVLSLPDALSTLENRVGDCNEHAVLLAALARATGIPAKVEAGLVYLKGRFYYHAWNLLYLGRWITADSLFGQMPADVTHIRFSSGTQKQQLDLMNIIGKVELKVVEQSK